MQNLIRLTLINSKLLLDSKLLFDQLDIIKTYVNFYQLLNSKK